MLAVLVLLVPHASSAVADAAPKRITGKLSKPGFTVLALAQSGLAKSDRAKRGSFSVKPPAAKVTLHLRAKDGTYAGPLVLARDGKRRAITGVKPGARLGRVKVDTRNGFAKTLRELAPRVIDEKRFARATRGIPIGARKYGRVRSRRTRGGVPGDRDLDGVPDVLDVDDDGDLVLDNVDLAGSARALSQARARARGTASDGEFTVRSVLAVPIWETANANATALTAEDIDSALTSWGRLIVKVMPGDTAELDCGGAADPADPNGWGGGLRYCTRGGSGTVVPSGPSPPPHPSLWSPFPGPAGGEFDPDGDGFGTVSPGPAFHLAPVATSAQIGTGDILIQRVSTAGVETEFTLMLPFIFATTPALVSYDDGQGNAATVGYPVADPIPGPTPGAGGPGTDDDPFPVKPGPSGDVLVTLIFWRPQRRPIPPEPGEWTDMGGLTYSAGIADGGCPQGAFSTADTSLVPASSDVPYAPGAGGLVDQAADQPATPASTLSYTLNLSECVAARGLTWNPGEAMSFSFGAVDSPGGNVSVTETVPGATFELQP